MSGPVEEAEPREKQTPRSRRRRLAAAALAAIVALNASGVNGSATGLAADSGPARRDPSRVVHSMDEARIPKTKTSGGLKTGLLIGGVAGLGAGVVLGLIANSLDDDKLLNDTTGWGLWLGGWTLAGLGAGALVGTLVGSTLEAETPGGASTAPNHRTGPLGSVTLEAMGGTFVNRPDGDAGAGGRIQLQVHRGPRFRIGLEHGRLYSRPRLYSTALSIRYAPWRGVYGLVALGHDHFAPGGNLFGPSAGVALETSHPEANDSWVVEGRYHFTLQDTNEGNGRFGLVTLALGRRFGW